MTSDEQTLDPEKVVATFDSASELHAALVATLEHRPFPHLGNPELYARAIRAAGHLPWPILRSLYTRIGGAEGIDPENLDRVSMDAVAASFADAFTQPPYPALFIGSSNGALMHLAAAMKAPWLPGTVLVPVHHTGDGDRPDRALDFGRHYGPRLLDRNPGITLHQMHDSAQDALMTTRMAYFRTKWTTLPPAYTAFIRDKLLPGAPVFLVDDTSTWPVTHVGPRHVFQTGGRGGLTPEQHLQHPHAPAADTRSAEAEWGADPQFSAAVTNWCDTTNHPLTRLQPDGPQTAAAPVADILRHWTKARTGEASRLLVPSFVITDPWPTFTSGRVPFWTYFPVQEALDSLDTYLADSEPYDEVAVTMFQHGVQSPGLASPEDFEDVVHKHGAAFTLIAVDPKKSPHDIGSMTKYGPELETGITTEPSTSWEPLTSDAAKDKLDPLIQNTPC